MPKQSTPWGLANKTKIIAPGIVKHYTPSHGGIELSPERQTEARALFPAFTPWSGSWRWLEEDCDALIAIWAWPEYFEVPACAYALSLAKSPRAAYYSFPASYWDTPQGKRLTEIANSPALVG